MQIRIHLYSAIFILGNAARVYTVYCLFRLLYGAGKHTDKRIEKQTNRRAENREDSRREWAVYLLYFAVLVAAGFLWNGKALTERAFMAYYMTDILLAGNVFTIPFFIEVICLGVISLLYGKNMIWKLLSVAGIASALKAGEWLSIWLLKTFGTTWTLNVKEITAFKMMFSVMLVYLFGRFAEALWMWHRRRGEESIGFYLLFILLVPCAVFFLSAGLLWRLFSESRWSVGFLQTYFSGSLLSRETEMMIILVFACCFGMFWLCNYVIQSTKRRYEKMLLQQENQYYEDRLKNIEQSAFVWKKIRHDLKNHFITLHGMLEAGQEQEAKIYLEELMQNGVGNEAEIQTGTPVIDSILNYKRIEAKQREMTLNTDIQIPENLAVSPHTMSVILGNAIDNAIEAAEQTEEKRIDLTLRYTKGRLLLHIRNPYRGDLKPDGVGGFFTEKTDAENHGIGIKSIRAEVEKSGGALEIETEENWFILTLLLYV